MKKVSMKKDDQDIPVLTRDQLGVGVRGKYINRLARGSNVVVLDNDVQKLFPDSAAVNAALRALGKAVEVAQTGKGATSHATRARATTARAG
jgi:hypothetical protein